MTKLFWSLSMAAAVALAALTVRGAAQGIPTSSPKNEPSGVEVNIDNFSFSSMTLTVPSGTRVTWINKDDVPHTVVSADKLFTSAALDTGERFSYTFTKPGTYPYYCSIHPRMTAKVVVE